MLGQAIAAEFIRLRRAKTTWLTALGVAAGPLFGGLFMWILQEPGRAEQLGLIGQKAQFALGMGFGATGWGKWFPWSIVPLYAGVAGPRAETLAPGSLGVLGVTCVAVVMASIWQFTYADNNQQETGRLLGRDSVTASPRSYQMTTFAVRVFLFSVLPLLISAGVILFDRTTSSRERRLEVPLIMLFAVGVAGSGIGAFISHLFFGDVVAASIGWPTGSPFQLEMASANLALGLLGVVAAGRRDGFREATVIAVTVLGVGASIVHVMDIVATGNLAPGNTIQNAANLIKPAFLIPLLVASRRAERFPNSEAQTPRFDLWRAPLLQASAVVTAIVATAFGIGFAFDEPLLVSALGAIAASASLAVILARSPTRRPRS
jgi:Family of unknown function (DUF6790)